MQLPTVKLNEKHQRIADIGGTIFLFLNMLLLALFLSSCGFYVGVDWNGQTAKSFRTYTDKQESKK